MFARVEHRLHQSPKNAENVFCLQSREPQMQMQLKTENLRIVQCTFEYVSGAFASYESYLYIQ